jgi:hypothetical protein
MEYVNDAYIHPLIISVYAVIPPYIYRQPTLHKSPHTQTVERPDEFNAHPLIQKVECIHYSEMYLNVQLVCIKHIH